MDSDPPCLPQEPVLYDIASYLLLSTEQATFFYYKLPFGIYCKTHFLLSAVQPTFYYPPNKPPFLLQATFWYSLYSLPFVIRCTTYLLLSTEQATCKSTEQLPLSPTVICVK